MSSVEQDHLSSDAARHGLSRTKLLKCGLLITASLAASGVVIAAALLMWSALHPRLSGFGF